MHYIPEKCIVCQGYSKWKGSEVLVNVNGTKLEKDKPCAWAQFQHVPAYFNIIHYAIITDLLYFNIA